MEQDLFAQVKIYLLKLMATVSSNILTEQNLMKEELGAIQLGSRL